jgi:hypothetical protein
MTFVIEDNEDGEEEDAVPLDESPPADNSRCTSDEETRLLPQQRAWMCCCRRHRGCALM